MSHHPQNKYLTGLTANVQTSLAGKQNAADRLTELAGLTSPVNDNVLQFKAGVVAQRTIAQLKSDLGLSASDFNLGNVPNVDCTDASNISSGTIDQARLPAIAIVTKLADAADETAMLALSGQEGDWTIRTDENRVYVISGSDPSDVNDWTSLAYPADAVTSVAGLTGVISDSGLKTALSLAKGDVGLGNVDNTADADKPVSTATQTALDAKQSLAAAPTEITADAQTLPASVFGRDDRVVLFTGAGGWNEDLPTYASVGDKEWVTFINATSSTVQLDRQGSDTVLGGDDPTYHVLQPGASCKMRKHVEVSSFIVT